MSRTCTFDSVNVTATVASEAMEFNLETATTPSSLSDRIVRDCVALCCASYYEGGAAGYLQANYYAFKNFSVSDIHPTEGYFIVAEAEYDGEKIVYLAVRGSVNSSDWAVNFSFWPTTTSNGFVHTGWYNRSANLPVNYLADLAKQGYRVVITGHSLGGAVAQLLTSTLLDKFTIIQDTTVNKRINCVTFASPLTFVGHAAETLNSLHKDNFFHFVHPLDIVPKVLSWCQAVITVCADCIADLGMFVIGSFKAEIRKIISVITGLVSMKDASEIWQYCEKIMGLSEIKKHIASTFLNDFFSYRPVGQFFVIGRDGINVRCPLTDNAVAALLSYSNFKISSQMVFSHQVESNYAPWVLRGLDLPHSGTDSGNVNVPNEMKSITAHTLPKPTIRKISLLPIHGTSYVEIRMYGDNLHCVKNVSTQALPMECKVDRKVIFTDCQSPRELCFRVEKSSSGKRNEKLTMTTDVIVSTFFSHEPIICKDVFIFMESYHTYDGCSLYELLLASFYILIFAQKTSKLQEGTADDDIVNLSTLNNISDLIQEIFGTIPVEAVLTTFRDPLTVFLLRDENTLRKIWHSNSNAKDIIRKLIRKENSQYQKFQEESVSFITEFSGLVKHENDIRELAKHNDGFERDKFTEQVAALEREPLNNPPQVLSFLQVANASKGEGTVLDKILQFVEEPLMRAGKELKENPDNAERYKSFIANLAFSLLLARNVSMTFGKYYSNKLTETGEIHEVLDAFLSHPTVRVLLSALTWTYTFGPSSIGIGYGVALIALGVTGWGILASVGVGVVYLSSVVLFHFLFGQFPQDVINTSFGLREFYVARIKDVKNYHQSESVGLKEKALEVKLIEYNLTGRESWEEYWKFTKQLLQRSRIITEGYNIEGEQCQHISRRLKLLVLSSHLRSALKDLPIVELSGVTSSGKSLLRELLVHPDKPDDKAYGRMPEHRTVVPKLLIAGMEKSKRYCILDTIGLSDQTFKDPAVKELLQSANRIFSIFASATVLVIANGDERKVPVASEQCTITSIYRGDMSVLNHPILTCFNKADMVFEDLPGGNFPDDCEKTLDKFAQQQCSQGIAYDLRSIDEDPTFPRVFSCFKSSIKLPLHKGPRTDSKLIGKDEVELWIQNIFHPKK
jgi:hypothetical protein